MLVRTLLQNLSSRNRVGVYVNGQQHRVSWVSSCKQQTHSRLQGRGCGAVALRLMVSPGSCVCDRNKALRATAFRHIQPFLSYEYICLAALGPSRFGPVEGLPQQSMLPSLALYCRTWYVVAYDMFQT